MSTKDLALPADLNGFTAEQLDLITNTVARGASKLELQLFLYRCQKMGLDPLKAGEIHFIKYGNNPGTIVVGIEGFRNRAARTGKNTGTQRGVLRNDKGDCTGGWAKVRRSDWAEPAEVEVSLAEYSTGKANWVKMPETMIQKVAEAAALRMAFPNELGDAYSPEETEKVAQEPIRIGPEQPASEDGVQSRSYFVPYGPMARRPIEECDPVELRIYIEAIEKKAKDEGKPVPAWALELIKNAEPLIAAHEQTFANYSPRGGT